MSVGESSAGEPPVGPTSRIQSSVTPAGATRSRFR